MPDRSHQHVVLALARQASLRPSFLGNDISAAAVLQEHTGYHFAAVSAEREAIQVSLLMGGSPPLTSFFWGALNALPHDFCVHRLYTEHAPQLYDLRACFGQFARLYIEHRLRPMNRRAIFVCIINLLSAK